MRIHGTSHSLAYFVCTISAALIVGLISRYMPLVLNGLNRVSTWILDSSGIQGLESQHLNVLMLSLVLTYIWGMAFKLVHPD